MSQTIAWMAAEAEGRKTPAAIAPRIGRRVAAATGDEELLRNLPAHQFGAGKLGVPANQVGAPQELTETAPESGPERTLAEILQEDEEIRSEDEIRARRIYRSRTVTMLRRYLKYSIETGRMPSVLGKEFFRAKVSAYPVATFEDRVIFVHDMESCLGRLDEFLRQLIARRVLQEHDRWTTARLLHCNEKTVRRLTPFALDQLGDILLERGLMERAVSIPENSCQGGLESEFSVSDCEEGENKF